MIQYHDFLERLADGKCTVNDWRFVIQNSKHTMGETEWRNRGFDEVDTTYLFPTNKEVNSHNVKQLKKLGNPIVRINSLNSSSRAKNLSPESFRGLRNFLYLCVGSKVVLTLNIRTELGLCNGTTGVVRDIIYEQDTKPPALPTCVWCDFGSQYTGEPLFTDPSKSGWVPITPRREIYYMRQNRSTDSDWSEHSRTMIPLRLAWAWTIWKAQGQTMTGKVAIKLGDKEVEHGLSYVAFSRATRYRNVGIIGGVTATRLTTEITKLRKLTHRLREDERLNDLASSFHLPTME